MKILLAIGLGSFIGGICRYLLSQIIHIKTESLFPMSTFIVNIIGSFAIGLVFALAAKGDISKEFQLFLATGVLGGFTTYSAFSNETFILMRDGHLVFALIYILTSITIGLLATFLGYSILKLF
ncbi:fluoride efflux transporter CrcB [Sphingobacterium composti Ten et al. 2007 non Yoo et al. 2007]|uniref:fluoride efflux transporter CrcB n=1 Tax=Sphingobacterium composti TaxID=363260 RepID=UPI001358CBF4|nr:fluoride efflux transporter CrcB [Sphingobacterium composti Ten et al. 2007 non Yoo et al. 2007]